ncbi:FAD binding domain-containing protein [Aspergillus sp. HF37]|nr:FAD binding domain-containing protein [Aspergillus sp. HF37]
MPIQQADQPAAAGKKIIIVGAGIAGLSLALSIRKQWPDGPPPPSLTIYERESNDSMHSREGYSLSIRGDALSGGMQVLQRLDSLERLLALSLSAQNSRPGSFNLWSTDWTSLLRVSPTTTTKCDDGGRIPAGMRISRSRLRRVLINAICESDRIVWNSPCTHTEPLLVPPQGRTRVHFPDGGYDDCDILSKIRAQLRPHDTLDFTGIVCISASARFPEGDVPDPVDADWGGVLGAGNGVGLFVAPVSSSSALWSLSYPSATPRERLGRPFTKDEVDALLAEALEKGRGFCEPFQRLVRATDPETLTVLNAMDKQPFGHGSATGTEAGRVVFIGDANHAVSPFAGNGANMAMLDGWDLAEQLARNSSMETALEAYDGRSMPRSASTVRHSRWAIDMMHATGLKLAVYRGLLWLVGLVMRWKQG